MERDNILAHGEEILPDHDFITGSWKRVDRYNYETKTDVCSMCQCHRVLVRNKHFPDGSVSSYWRGKMSFSPDHMPTCWPNGKPDD